ncbi:outer membrane protein with beta-barrel domain [Tenacibaculum adriaticum]|uniref:Outer membrane protein with beta-barrel domain n=1 Tax=Tenacibaculum adriaticum TaxID=413713 RepID=A0A5S5DVH7_9FLAO|nr:porin family protein [Tenacibaculum adriaticum]TYP99845.1 outer membrane protein with beta-barrel domain [Tenacibaculum adriaticum]
MNKKLFLLFVFFTAIMSAQNFGIKGGINFSNLTNFDKSFEEEVESESIRTSFHVGFYNEFKINDNLSIQPELLYSSQGINNESDGIDGKVQLDYINIPVLLKIYLTEGFFLEAGPQIGFLVNDDIKVGTLNFSDNEDLFNTVDYSMDLGLGFKLSEGVFLNARYGFGLNGVFNSSEEGSDNNPKNSVFAASLGFNL